MDYLADLNFAEVIEIRTGIWNCNGASDAVKSSWPKGNTNLAIPPQESPMCRTFQSVPTR